MGREKGAMIMLNPEERRVKIVEESGQGQHHVHGDAEPSRDYPPIPVTVTTWATHLGVATSLLEGCGHAVGSYIQWAAVQLYTLGWAHPERWLQWDADRAALRLSGFIPGWLYLVAIVCGLVLSGFAFKMYVRVVRAANERAWVWIRDFIYHVTMDALSDFLRILLENQAFLRWVRDVIRKIVLDALRDRGNGSLADDDDPPDDSDDPLSATPSY